MHTYTFIYIYIYHYDDIANLLIERKLNHGGDSHYYKKRTLVQQPGYQQISNVVMFGRTAHNLFILLLATPAGTVSASLPSLHPLLR